MADRPEPAPVSPSQFGIDGAWLPVSTAESGAFVFRSADATGYAKCVTAAGTAELAAERDRIAWLDGKDIPGPRVLDWTDGEAGACLLTSAVHGVPADQLPPEDLWRAWDDIADAVRRLHELPVRACPYRRNLDEMVARARDVVARDAVNPEFLPDDQQHTPPMDLLAALTQEAPLRRAQEPADTVVCHGDLCLPNIILDPTTWAVSGFIDLGRLGQADRHADLALLLANARETWPTEARAQTADTALAARYGTTLDPDRLRFYLHLDPLTWG
ncbi:APH(3'') family aminoglycoside O-phosphotransferase [Kitasatospora sp. NPDC008115]|uniref:APH(3'') family aminoglycoside O-phosphotransferase n=1 Tax=Kitasatospora sp. NPDC008115 TaxID=3364022 RepID=UPI0036E9DA44